MVAAQGYKKVKSTKICEKVNPDFIDINYGCPVKKVTFKGAGSCILKDIPKMVSMTKGIGNSTHLPVTVKTRLGWDGSFGRTPESYGVFSLEKTDKINVF